MGGPSNSLCAHFREEHEVFDNKMQQDAQEMLRYFLTSLHDILLETISSLPPPPPPPVVPTTVDTVTMQEERDAIDVELYTSFSKLATRKRKLPQDKRDRCKVAKTLRRKSASSTKVTDYFRLVNSSDVEVKDVRTPSARPRTPSARPREEKPHWHVKEDLDFVKEIFQGELVSQIRCYECDNFTRRTEPFLDVSLAVSSPGLPGFPVDSTPSSTSHDPQRTLAREMRFVGPFSLSWVLSQFCLREKLRGDNKYSCERCGHLAEAERSVMFGRLPLVVTLHLNRFATHSMNWMSSGGNLMVNKVGGNVAVPLTLKFSAWCTDDCTRRDEVYHLIAVVFHTGSSCSTGHYTACVRGKECSLGNSLATVDWIKTDTAWVDFDDEVVTLITQDELLEKLSPLTPSTAYILFYSVNQCS